MIEVHSVIKPTNNPARLTKKRDIAIKLLLILTGFISITAIAEEECAFDDKPYVEFIEGYAAENENSKIDDDVSLPSS